MLNTHCLYRLFNWVRFDYPNSFCGEETVQNMEYFWYTVKDICWNAQSVQNTNREKQWSGKNIHQQIDHKNDFVTVSKGKDVLWVIFLSIQKRYAYRYFLTKELFCICSNKNERSLINKGLIPTLYCCGFSKRLYSGDRQTNLCET